MTQSINPPVFNDERSERMPVDLRTMLLGIWKCRWALFVWSLFAVGVAVVVALTVAPQKWKAETVLLYQPPSNELLAGMYKPPSIHTQLNMVKVKPNLAETRMRLKLDCTLTQLGAACQLKTPRDSQLLVCEVNWDGPDQVADIANTLCDVFIQRQERLRRMELTSVIREMENRLVLLRKKLDQTGQNKSDETIARERELESYRNRINSADELYEKAITELKARERQIAELDLMDNDLRQKLLSGTESGKGETMSSLNIRVERIREKILDAKQHQADALTTIQWEERMKFNERMLAHGFLSKEAFEHELAEFQKHKQRSTDSPEIQQLKAELDDIYQRMKPNSLQGVEASPLVQSLTIERYQLQLEHSAAQERVAQLERSRVRLQREYQALSRGEASRIEHPPHLIESWVAESRQLEEALAKVRAVAESNASDFGMVSRAVRPSFPSRSYRKVAFLGIAGVAMTVGIVGVIFAQLINTTIRSGADATIKLDRDEVCVLPKISEATQGLLDERIRALAERIRLSGGKQGARVLVASANEGEGRTLLSKQLAECVARRGNTVIVLDASVRKAPQYQIGLGDFLAFDDVSVAEMLEPGDIDGVFHIGRGTTNTLPDLLAGERMNYLLNELSNQFDLVLIDGPSGVAHADADVLARQSDGVLMVVKAEHSKGREVKEVVDRLETAGASMLSVVLNQTDSLFIKNSF